MPKHLDLSPMMNNSGLDIEKFVKWPKTIDFTNYDYNDIIMNKTEPQRELTSNDMTSGNFEILCLSNKTIEMYSFEICLQLYEEYKDVLERKDD